MDRINLLHVIGGLGIGGTERQLLELCRRLGHDRFNTSVVCYSMTSDGLDDAFRASGIRVILLDKFDMPRWKFFPRLRAVIRESSPDIVHTWLYSANFWGRWAASAAGVPKIIASERAEVEQWRLIPYLSDRLLRRRTIRLANSRAVAASLVRFRGLRETDIRVIHNAVEVPELDRSRCRADIRSELNVPPETRIVLMVGRQTVEKNYPMFVRAGVLLGQQRPDTVFVGVGRRNTDARLEGLVSSLNGEAAVRLVGHRDDVNLWLAAADVFCLTSDHEGFPNVLLEAMAAELPLVCTDFASAREVVPAGDVGIVIPRNDHVALARAVAGLLDDEGRRRKLGCAARAHVTARYGWDRLVGQMIALYEELAAGRRSIAAPPSA